MQQVYKNKKDCCGCTACESACPHNAITMQSDSEGFLYPVIDSKACINCGLCRSVCPFTNSESLKNGGQQSCYSCVHKETEVLKASTSGGAFTALSDCVLQRGGVVYGADFDENYNVYHSRAETAQQRDRQRVSKYSQSDLSGVFDKVKDDLKQGREVLFCGTPCQVAALKAYIPRQLTEKLYLCDLICHSIPSPLIWQEYKKYQENKYGGGKMTQVMFRSKIHPWTRDNSNRGFVFELDGDGVLHEDNSFYDLFFTVGTITRPSCENCKFASQGRVGAITIADYWGIEEFSPESYNPLGVSVVLANNSKGEKLVYGMKQYADMQKRDISEQLKHQKRLSEPAKYPENRAQFWDDFHKYGFAYVMDKYIPQK